MFWEELIAYFLNMHTEYLMQGLHRKYRVQQFHSYACIRCSGNVFTELLPSNGRLFWLHYSSFLWGTQDTEVHRKQGHLISTPLFFFKIRKVD
jgi:hypothetical protein